MAPWPSSTPDNAALADAMRFEQVRGEDGSTLAVSTRSTARARFATGARRGRRRRKRVTTESRLVLRVRVGQARRSSTTVVGCASAQDHGALLYAEVEVRVPRRALVGDVPQLRRRRSRPPVSRGASCSTRPTASITARAGSAATSRPTPGRATSGRARPSGARSSATPAAATCIVNWFEGKELSCDTGSGEVRVADARAERLVADTGSGSIQVERSDVEDFSGDTGSGAIEAELTGTRLRRIKADTGSGHVSLRLPRRRLVRGAADQGSGSLSTAASATPSRGQERPGRSSATGAARQGPHRHRHRQRRRRGQSGPLEGRRFRPAVVQR